MDSVGSVRVLMNVRGKFCSGFDECSGLTDYRFYDEASSWLRSARSGCSVKVVEKLCRSLWETLWGKGGELCGKAEGWSFGVEKVGQNGVLHGLVEKFYYGFSTRISLCKRWVLHSFHIAYYYNYYFYIRKESYGN